MSQLDFLAELSGEARADEPFGGIPDEVLEEMERDLRAARMRDTILAEYADMKRREVPESDLDAFFEAHKAVLQDAGIHHYPLLSDAEKQIIHGWLDLQRRGERRAVMQEYWNQHSDVLARRWGAENPEYQPE